VAAWPVSRRLVRGSSPGRRGVSEPRLDAVRMSAMRQSRLAIGADARRPNPNRSALTAEGARQHSGCEALGQAPAVGA
jgi:hypothetical protein